MQVLSFFLPLLLFVWVEDGRVAAKRWRTALGLLRPQSQRPCPAGKSPRGEGEPIPLPQPLSVALPRSPLPYSPWTAVPGCSRRQHFPPPSLLIPALSPLHSLF